MAQEQSQERVQSDRLAKLGSLFAGFAHEVRNPLSTIGLNLGLIKEDFVDAQSARDLRTYKRLSTLENEVKRLQGILDEFLNFVRKPELRPRATDVNRFLRELFDFSAPEAESEGVAMRLYPGQGVGEAVFDPDMIRSALVNLLRNARQACSEGDQIMISSERERGSNEVIIRVTDTGAGMSEEVQRRALSPYLSQKKGGTGLGLPITLRLIEEHGGSMDFSSEEGRGTQFTIRLPVARKGKH